MKKLFRFLKPYSGSVLMILMVLMVQAYCDLSLPTYTSDIVNVGIQQSGITEKVPDEIAKEDLEHLLLFVPSAQQKTVREAFEESQKSYDYDGKVLALKESVKEEQEEESEDDRDADAAFFQKIQTLKKGMSLEVSNLAIKEGKTSPPKRYNSGSLILAMENAGQLIEDEELRAQIKGSGIGTSATRAEILKKLFSIKYLSLNKKTQVITPTLLGEMIFDVVNCSIRQLLNPELTASWEKGLTYVAEGSITPQEYMDKLEHFVRVRTVQVEQSNYQYALRQFFDAAAENYKKKPSASKRGGKEL